MVLRAHVVPIDIMVRPECFNLNAVGQHYACVRVQWFQTGPIDCHSNTSVLKSVVGKHLKASKYIRSLRLFSNMATRDAAWHIADGVRQGDLALAR